MRPNKEENLRNWMHQQVGVLVAYSGGVDSAYLALVATQELKGRAVCVTGVSPSVSTFQLDMAKRIAAAEGFEHRMLRTHELKDESYQRNTGDRCYFCKSELYSRISEMAADEYPGFTIVDGSNADDISDYRPGRIAARELAIRSPLEELGLTKNEIRLFSHTLNLETWDKPASPCLSSRVAIGVPVTIERLSKIERGEKIIRRRGFREFRLRVYGKQASIEIAISEMKMPGFVEAIDELKKEVKGLGFRSVSLNPDGFRSGSLNETQPGV